MIIDVLVNSCARPEVLDVSFHTFRKKVTSVNHTFRYILLEDYVEDETRRNAGLQWIENNKKYFDEIHLSNKKLGFWKYWSAIIKLCKSDIHIHMEDDQEFIVDVDVDPLINLVEKESDVASIILRRGPSKDIIRKSTLHGVEVVETGFYSDSIGVFDTKWARKIIDKIGWDNDIHENGNLTPISKKLGLRKFVLGHNDDMIHYVHVGGNLGYKQGKYKK